MKEYIPESLLQELDPAIQYMYYRDVLHDEEKMKLFQNEALKKGIVHDLLNERKPNGHWGLHYYQPKWTSTHYTLLDLVDFGLKPDHLVANEVIQKMLKECLDEYHTLDFSKTKLPSDSAINGMALNYLLYFNAPKDKIQDIVNFLIQNQQEDGGFSWAHHREVLPSDRNSSICIGEGLLRYYLISGRKDLEQALNRLVQYFKDNNYWLEDVKVKKLSYPYRYYYSLLRVLEFFTDFHQEIPNELKEWLHKKRGDDGYWKLENFYPGNIHFPYETLHQNSLIVTIKALKILNRE